MSPKVVPASIRPPWYSVSKPFSTNSKKTSAGSEIDRSLSRTWAGIVSQSSDRINDAESSSGMVGIGGPTRLPAERSAARTESNSAMTGPNRGKQIGRKETPHSAANCLGNSKNHQTIGHEKSPRKEMVRR